MANLKASKKDIKKNKRNRKYNVHFLSMMKTMIKKAIVEIESKGKNIKEKVTAAAKQIDKTHQKGIIHKNTANRKKSKLMKLANAAK